IIYPADSIDFEVTINATGLSCGDHIGYLEFTSNDSNYPEGSIPVQVHVYTPDIYIAETSIDKNLSSGDTSTYVLAIANDGPGRLDFQADCQMYRTSTDISNTNSEITPIGYHPADTDKPGSLQPYFAPITMGFGGPDIYGHSWVDSDEGAGPVFDWVDISVVGTEVTLDDDDYAGPLTMGFDFPFYDSVYSEVYLGSNGILTFDEGSGSRANSSLPNTEFSSLIAGWWDDLDPSEGGHIYYYYDDANDRFVVSFVDIMFYMSSTGTGSLSFQMLLYSDGAIGLQYGTMDSGELTLETATIGIQNSEANDGLQVVYNAPYMHDNLAIGITAEHWVSVMPEEGSIDPLGNTTIDVRFDASGLETGEYTGQLVISSNDPDTPSWNIPVTLNVSSWVCGDADGSGDGPDVADLVYLVNYMFNDGPPPPVLEAVNIDGLGGVDIADLVYLVNYMFNDGPSPDCQ
ncbi:MAG: hypothetical protein U9R56_00005, partial [candidate division Zixibacteria bacterium]|nr:hypothetical protein [candidate division Zixibacteria bacterium]